MSGYTVPLSSSPQGPSTPGIIGQRPKGAFDKTPNGISKNPFAAYSSSTTPAGPPPSSARSFTPAGPPPSSILRSSQLASRKTPLKSKSSVSTSNAANKNTKVSAPGLARFLDRSSDFKLPNTGGAVTKNMFGVPSSSPPSGSNGYDEEEDSAEGSQDDEIDRHSDTFQDGTMDIDTGSPDHSFTLGSIMSNAPNGSIFSGNSVAFDASATNATPRGIKRSRGGASIMSASPRSARKVAKTRQESAIPSIAQNIATRYGVAQLEEKDDLIIGTEEILQQDLYGTELPGSSDDRALNAALPIVSERLSRFWRSSCAKDTANIAPKSISFQGVGPDDSAPPLHRAVFLGALQLQLRHPPTAKGKQALAVARLDRSSMDARATRQNQTPPNPTAMPRVLVDWLNNSHNPYEAVSIDVQKHQPNPTAHINYWDIIFSSTLRGKLRDVIHLLKRSDFSHARTSKEDRKDNDGYSALQVRNIERVMNRAIQVFERCPSILDDNWNVTGNDWILFRKQIEQELNDLATFSEGRDRDNDPAESTFEASNFGLRSTSMGLSQSARKAESRVPWTVYQNLKATYGILLGGNTEILAMAQDWVEATVGLTIWWTGDDDEDMAVGSVAVTRRSLQRSQSRGTRLVDVNSNAAYLRRIACSLEIVTDEDLGDEQLPINTLNPVEVGLASIFEGNVDGVMGLLRAFSLPVASAVAEVASEGGWFEPSVGAILDGLDESDLLMLSGPISQKRSLTRDIILMEYADAISDRDIIQGAENAKADEGWELSISILTRLEDEIMATKAVKDLLKRLPRGSDVRVDKILHTCSRFGIIAEARGITEEYADHVAETSENYGTALIYYARAQAKKKVQDVLDLLVSLSLVQSIAFPPPSALDPNLHALVFSPEQSLGQLRLEDPGAAEMLHTSLTGYATLRRFYDLRDEVVNLDEGQKPRLRSIARKSAAVAALIALINSAADTIHGGLYDEDSDAVIRLDGLLALLGEATVFVNQPKSVISQRQSFSLMKAVEDIETVTPRVYAGCEECFQSTLAAFQRRATPAPPRELLKKTMSSMTSAGSFSLVGSSMLDSETSSGMDSSKALVKSQEEEKRGWDWRKGLGKDAKGSDVLRILRLGLAKEIARHWIT